MDVWLDVGFLSKSLDRSAERLGLEKQSTRGRQVLEHEVPRFDQSSCAVLSNTLAHCVKSLEVCLVHDIRLFHELLQPCIAALWESASRGAI